VVALAICGTSATIAISWNLALIITGIFVEKSALPSLVNEFIFLAAGGVIKATVIWLQELISAMAADAVKVQLRSRLLRAIFDLGSEWLNKNTIAEINLLATNGLISLEPYFSRYLPQLVYTAIITPVFVFVIWSQDPASGFALIFTLPLIPIFMMLIGWATRTVQAKQFDALSRLTGHFLEVMRGMTTLRVFGRAELQVKKIAEVSEAFRLRTMNVLRITFLSGFALELIGSLSVALIAVSIGLRLVNGEIPLLTGLFVLLLAPEAYLPIRQVGAHFHAASEGVTASQKILDIIELSKSQVESEASCHLKKFNLGTLNVIVGKSGSGKSTIFREMLGLTGRKAELEFSNVAWMPQRTMLFAGTVLENVVGVSGADSGSYNRESLKKALKLAQVDDLSLDLQVGQGGSQISGGQAQRVSLARCFYRAITTDVSYLLLDEPISAIDETRARSVVASLLELSGSGRTVIAITHQGLLSEAASNILELSFD